jgi:flagellar biosynthetic protein FlhB
VAEERDDSQRTEEPTQRRLDEAQKKGDVVKSQELSTFVMTAGGALALALFAQSSAREFASRFIIFLDSPAQISLDGGAAKFLLYKSVFGLLPSWPTAG